MAKVGAPRRVPPGVWRFPEPQTKSLLETPQNVESPVDSIIRYNQYRDDAASA